MNEAAPQAAKGTSTADLATVSEALAALRLEWGHAYRIGHDDVRGWWARRRDGLGADITAGTPDELRAAVARDHESSPVPRHVPGWVETWGGRS